MAEMLGYCWPLSGAAGDILQFRATTTSANFSVTYVDFQNADPASVDDNVIRSGGEMIEIPISSTFQVTGTLQNLDHTPSEGANDWLLSFSMAIPAEWSSSIYAAKCVDDDGSTFFIPFIVRPSASSLRQILVLANTNTWNAYNPEFGYSRYVGASPFNDHRDLSFLRPNRTIFNPTIDDYEFNAAGYAYGLTSKDHLRGELWILNWLRQVGYLRDVCTDLDLHTGLPGLGDYRCLLVATHPEYWTQQMYLNLRSYLETGGTLLYLGGNGIFDSVTLSDDLTVMTTYGDVLPVSARTHSFRNLGLPEGALLGVATPDGPNAGNNFPERVAYRVEIPPPGQALHRFFDGTGLQPGDEFGHKGWFLATGEQEIFSGTPASISNSGASGGECDRQDASAPANTERLATGINIGNHAAMTYYDLSGGGFVFSAGSIAFGGALVIDWQLQRIVRNALDEKLDYPESDPFGYVFINEKTGLTEQHNLFRDAAEHIDAAWFNFTGGWRREDRTRLVPGTPQAVGRPMGYSFVDDASGLTEQHNLFCSADGHVHALWFNFTDGWRHEDRTMFVPGTPPAASDPFGYTFVDKTAGVTEQHNLFRSADGHVHALWFNFTDGWRHEDRTMLVPGTPSAVGSLMGYPFVDEIAGLIEQHNLFCSADGHLHALWFNFTDGWHHEDRTMLLPGVPPAVSDPFGYTFVDETAGLTEQHNLFCSADGHVHAVWFNFTDGWRHEDRTMLVPGVPPAVGNPMGYSFVNEKTGLTEQHNLFRSADGHIHALWFNFTDGWRHEDRALFAPDVPPAVGDPFGYAFVNETTGLTEQHNLFRSADGHIHALWFNFTDGWRHEIRA
jgi:hypothetical protein